MRNNNRQWGSGYGGDPYDFPSTRAEMEQQARYDHDLAKMKRDIGCLKFCVFVLSLAFILYRLIELGVV